MAADYDEVRPDFAAASEKTLKDVQQADAPDAKSVVAELLGVICRDCASELA